MTEYIAARDRLQHAYRSLPEGSPIRLRKPTSNLFRPRSAHAGSRLDVSEFAHVFSIDRAAQTADVGGMTTYGDLVAATLPHGLMPKCVPQLKTITLGGAVTGLGIESASFRNGCPHESVLEMDLLLGSGEVLTVTPAHDDPNRALFFGFPNSYGSLGYALRLRIELEPAPQFVQMRHIKFADVASLSEAIAQITGSHVWDGQQVDFMDGTRFSAQESYLTLGRLVDSIDPATVPSNYTGQDIYYRSIPRRSTDVLTTHDYLWRWDTDWFWCSRAFGAQHPIVRRFWPRHLRRSDVYWKLVSADRHYGFSRRVDRLRGRPEREYVVQDVEIPIAALGEFLEFFDACVGLSPIWLCPLKQRDASLRWPLYELDPQTTYVNVGFWSSVALPPGESGEAARINRLIEAKVTELAGRKSLYSTAYYDENEFAKLYGGLTYQELKSKYDPVSRFPGLYAKTVGRS
ncbi:MAG: FAD-binding oxidoreductase [Actinomycetes bacterium]